MSVHKINMDSKNKKELEKFSAYCKANPDLRFFQALLNYSDDNFSKKIGSNIGFIYFSDKRIESHIGDGLFDTYYLE